MKDELKIAREAPVTEQQASGTGTPRTAARLRQEGMDMCTAHISNLGIELIAYAEAWEYEREKLQAELATARQMLHPYADAKEISGMSWNCFNIIGDRKSIDEARRLEHRSAQLEEFRQDFDERIAALKVELAALKSPVEGEPEMPKPMGDYPMRGQQIYDYHDVQRCITDWRALLRTRDAEIADLKAALAAALSQAEPSAKVGGELPESAFQDRVQPWMDECFGPEISSDKTERNHRHLEESLELVQACGCTREEAHQLVDYVFDRTAGEPKQEVGGVMVTLAALCLAQGIDMHAAGEAELARIWTCVEKIRAKQAAKPKHSPLPAALQTRPQNQEPVRDERNNQADRITSYALAYGIAMSMGDEQKIDASWKKLQAALSVPPASDDAIAQSQKAQK